MTTTEFIVNLMNSCNPSENEFDDVRMELTKCAQSKVERNVQREHALMPVILEQVLVPGAEELDSMEEIPAQLVSSTEDTNAMQKIELVEQAIEDEEMPDFLLCYGNCWHIKANIGTTRGSNQQG